MGIVFSCFASSFLLLGEIFSTLFLAIGEISSFLIRGIFSLLVGICDVIAACCCCCQVPFSQRPDRDGYTYSTLATIQPNSPLKTQKKFSKNLFKKKQLGNNNDNNPTVEIDSPNKEKVSTESSKTLTTKDENRQKKTSTTPTIETFPQQKTPPAGWWNWWTN